MSLKDRVKGILSKLDKRLDPLKQDEIRKVGYYHGVCVSCNRMIGTYIYMDTLKENIIITCGHCGMGPWATLNLTQSGTDRVHKAIVLWWGKTKDDLEDLDLKNWKE